MRLTHFFTYLIALCVAAGAASAKSPKAKDYFSDRSQVALAEAAASGWVKEIDSAITSGADVNYVGAEGMTALIWTFLHGNRRGFEYLLEKGANPNSRMTASTLTSDGITVGCSAVSLAARHEDPWFLRMVLNHGGDPNIKNVIKGTTPVFESISLWERARPSQRVENLRLLIAAGAHLDVFDKDGITPLMRGVIRNRYDMVTMMLDAGADPLLASSPRKTLVAFIRQARVDPSSVAYKCRLQVIAQLASKGIEVPEEPRE